MCSSHSTLCKKTSGDLCLITLKFPRSSTLVLELQDRFHNTHGGYEVPERSSQSDELGYQKVRSQDGPFLIEVLLLAILILTKLQGVEQVHMDSALYLARNTMVRAISSDLPLAGQVILLLR